MANLCKIKNVIILKIFKPFQLQREWAGTEREETGALTLAFNQ